jgi:predicted nucleotidyltransferase
MFEGASEVFKAELCGGYRRCEHEFKDVDILIIRKDEGPAAYLLLKLVETLEELGIIVQ